MDNWNPVMLVLAVSTFGASLALWTFALTMWVGRRNARTQRLAERLGSVKPKARAERTLRLWHEGEEVTTTVTSDSEKLSRAERLARFCRNAGWEMPVQRIALLLMLAAFSVGAIVFVLTFRLGPAIIGAATVVLVFWFYANKRITSRTQLFERQLVDALGLCARALRAGHPLIASFQLIAEELSAPVGTMFGEISQQQDMGIPLEESLRRTAQVTDSPDMKLFSASMSINVQTGGNLADVVESLAALIRERMHLKRRFRVLIAQTEFSKRILLVMPPVMFGMMNVLNPEYVRPLYTTTMGHLQLMVAAVFLLVGWWVMNRLAAID